jgi:hypothetical protein
MKQNDHNYTNGTCHSSSVVVPSVVLALTPSADTGTVTAAKEPELLYKNDALGIETWLHTLDVDRGILSHHFRVQGVGWGAVWGTSHTARCVR